MCFFLLYHVCGEPNIRGFFYGRLITIIIKEKNGCMSCATHTPTAFQMNSKRSKEKTLHLITNAIEYKNKNKKNTKQLTRQGKENQNSIDQCLIALAFLLSCCCQLSLKKYFGCCLFERLYFFVIFPFEFIVDSKWLERQLQWHKLSQQ